MKHILSIATTLTALTLVGLALQPYGNPGQGVTLELYAQTTDASVHLSQPPQPGEMAIFARDLFQLGGTMDHPEPAGDPLGRNTIICTVVTTTEASCEGRWSLDGLGLITGSAYLDLTLAGNSDGPGAPVTGGSGEFRGARGVIHTRSVPGGQDQVWIIEMLGSGQI